MVVEPNFKTTGADATTARTLAASLVHFIWLARAQR
jgi:hypothetical protein